MPRKIERIDRIPEPEPAPTWDHFFSEELHEELSSSLCSQSEEKIAYLRSALPIMAERYVRARHREAKPGLADRRKELTRVLCDAKKLRRRLLHLQGLARVDFMAVATRYTGSGTTVNSEKPYEWLARTGDAIRDVGAVAGAAAKDLKSKSKKGGRPRHAAIRLLISDLAIIYHRTTGRRPGRRGPFSGFVNKVVPNIDPSIANTDREQLVREAVKEFRKA